MVSEERGSWGEGLEGEEEGETVSECDIWEKNKYINKFRKRMMCIFLDQEGVSARDSVLSEMGFLASGRLKHHEYSID